METQLTVKDLQRQAWTIMVRQQVNSGLSVNDWCEQNGVHPKTFYYRRKRIREEFLQQAAGPVFTELTPPCPTGSIPAAEGFNPSIMISVNGMSIGISRDTPRQLLSDVLEAARHA